MLGLAFHGGDITYPGSFGIDPTLPTTFFPSTADGIAGSASCNRNGCTYTGYVLGKVPLFTRLDGTVQIRRAADSTSVKVDLVDVDLDAAAAGPSTISAELEASSTTLSGTLSETTAFADDPSHTLETQSIGFQDVTFDVARDLGALVPKSGSLRAEWFDGAGSGREATISFP